MTDLVEKDNRCRGSTILGEGPLISDSAEVASDFDPLNNHPIQNQNQSTISRTKGRILMVNKQNNLKSIKTQFAI